MVVFWVVAPRSLHAIALMEAASTSETLVNFFQSTQRNNPEEGHLRTHRRENLKSYYFLNIHLNITLSSMSRSF
jgi:hypothetical protein